MGVRTLFVKRANEFSTTKFRIPHSLFRIRQFCAGVARWLPGLNQQFVYFMLEDKDPPLPPRCSIVPAAQFIELFDKLGLCPLAPGDVADGEYRHQRLAVGITDERATITVYPLPAGLEVPDIYLQVTQALAAQDAGQRPLIQ